MPRLYGGPVARLVLCTLGDLLLDVIVRLEQPLEPGADATAETRTTAGGQAANVAAWAASLGAETRFIGKRGDDPAGALAAGELTRRGVTVLGPVVGRNGVVVSLVGRDGDRAMASDRGVAPELTADELEDEWFDACNHLHLSGYSLMSSPIDDAAVSAARLVRAQGGNVSVDLASSSVIRGFGANGLRSRLDELRPEIVFTNEQERDALGVQAGAPAATWVIKRGAAGCAIERNGERDEFPAAAADVVDTTGAGDAFAAGYLVGGVELAVATAARCVGRLGAMP
jgi:sugar/nucleoside kinase (ribokinase family)